MQELRERAKNAPQVEDSVTSTLYNIESLVSIKPKKKIVIEEHPFFEEQKFVHSQDDLQTDEEFESMSESSVTPNANALKPFNMLWAFGINFRAGVRNLTKDDRTEIFFTASHFAIVYNYVTRNYRVLEGHQGTINSITSDDSGRWIITADNNSEENSIIVWDTEQYKPIYTMFNVYPKSGALLISISSSAKYLLTVGYTCKEIYSIDFWLWTYGQDKPNNSFRIPNTYGLPKRITFNQQNEMHIMLVFEKQVFFLNWDTIGEKLVQVSMPFIAGMNKIGNLTNGSYIRKCHESFVGSTKGCILVFGNTLYSKPFLVNDELDNAKIFINAIKIGDNSISCLRTVDELLVAGTSNGHIYFFDKQVRLLYWYTNLDIGQIRSISFTLMATNERSFCAEEKQENEDTSLEGECEFFQDKVRYIEKTTKGVVPTDASMQKNKLLIRDFIVATSDCNIYSVNYLSNTCTSLFHVADGDVCAIEANDSGPYLLVGYSSGRITLINYETKCEVNSIFLPNSYEDGTKRNTISCLKYSHQSLHLICGTVNGQIWVLDPTVLQLKIVHPEKHSNSCIQKIEFSCDNRQFAYFDDNRTIFLFLFNSEKERWIFKGQIQSHYKEICDILFIPNEKKPTLVSIGADRHIDEYNNTCPEEFFHVTNRDRFDQSAIPTAFIFLSKLVKGRLNGYYLIADNQQKYKMLSLTNKVIRSTSLGPAYGCFKFEDIRKMKMLHIKSRHKTKMLVFMTKKHIGLQLLPPDGNPFKYVGYLGHSEKLANFVISHDSKYLFTFGQNERSILMWEIIPTSVEIMSSIGGRDLEPYYCLIEGGKSGWSFQEMIDLFYYIQILEQGENNAQPRRVLDTVSLLELPDLIRACGYYPTDFEVENMLIEMKYRDFDETGKIREEFHFIDFVKLFLNHRPAYGYLWKTVEKAFQTVVQNLAGVEDSIRTSDFVDVLSSQGEAISYDRLLSFLQILMRIKDDEVYVYPEKMDFQTFTEMVLGVGKAKAKVKVEPKSATSSQCDL